MFFTRIICIFANEIINNLVLKIMQKIEIMGRLGRDAEIKTTNTGKQYIQLSAAVSVYNKKEKKNDTVWYSVTGWDERLVKLAQHFTKGKLLSIRGNFKASIYTNANNIPSLSLEISAEGIDFVLTGNSQNENTTKNQAPVPASDEPNIEVKSSYAEQAVTFDDNTDDLPF